jgi:hypothetical protein
MIVCLIHWKIRKGKEPEFIASWQTKYTVQNRDGLIGEYLSEVKTNVDYPYITWDFCCDDTANEAGCSHFLNVAIWQSAERFYDEIAKNFNDSRPILDFEIERRKRVLIAPIQWRAGPSALPENDSPGVK